MSLTTPPLFYCSGPPLLFHPPRAPAAHGVSPRAVSVPSSPPLVPQPQRPVLRPCVSLAYRHRLPAIAPENTRTDTMHQHAMRTLMLHYIIYAEQPVANSCNQGRRNSQAFFNATMLPVVFFFQQTLCTPMTCAFAPPLARPLATVSA